MLVLRVSLATALPAVTTIVTEVPIVSLAAMVRLRVTLVAVVLPARGGKRRAGKTGREGGDQGNGDRGAKNRHDMLL